MTLALLKHLGIDKVSVACHSGGTVYALDMLLHHPEILHPERSYMAIGAPWILPSRSNIWSMSLVQALPVGMVAQADKVIGFFNNTLGPAFTSSVGFSQLFTTPAPACHEEESESAKFEESLEPLLFKFVHAESIEGFSDESLFLMQKINGIPGFGDWLDYDDLVPKLVSALKGAGRQLTIDVFYAEEDSMIGTPGTAGPEWMNACWKGEQIGNTIKYNAKTIKGADHNTIWSIRRGVPEMVFRNLST
jgi:pimeloyl-ACP methyl ester carboxylesterase